MKKLLVLMTALAMGFILSTSASATIITFDALTGTEDTDVGSQYAEAGFILTAANGGNLYSWGSEAGDWGGYTGSAALFNESYSGTVLTSADGSLFDLNSVDISETFMAYPYEAELSITGMDAQGYTVTMDITLDGDFGYEAIIPGEDFTRLVSATFYTENGDDYQIDNINVSASAVPLPGAFMILGSGLLAVAAIVRKKP